MKKLNIARAGFIVLFLIVMISIGQTIRNDRQAIPAFVLDISLHGEYKVGDGDWKPIVKGEHIPASDGEVWLRGTFQKSFPDGEIVGPLETGECIAFYFDHIGGKILVNGMEPHVFDSENPQIGNGTCGKYRLVYEYTGMESEVIEIQLKNPHAYGNELAVDEFLDEMRIYTGNDFEFMLSQKTENLRILGFIIIFTAMSLLGIAMFSGLLHISQSKIMWLVGAIILFAGCWFVVKSNAAYIWNTNVALNTSLYIYSIMFYVFSFQMLSAECLGQVFAKKGNVLAAASGAWTGILILYAAVTNSKLYDMWAPWIIGQMIVSILLLIFGYQNLKHLKGYMKYIQIVCIMAQICLIADSIATWIGWWQGPLCSSFGFMIVFVVALFVVLRVFPRNIQAVMREKEIAAELEKNKTAIMLSQIQPHFLYNSLGAIRELCRQDPEDARNALSMFITYLRANMDSIQREHTIHFSKELDHISAYLQLEKLRFGDDLTVIYDILEDDFFIPSLTVQPLVENAVKHGICSREEGGTVTLHTHREGEKIIIRIQDDGIGFDASKITEKNHVGLRNVRNRLKYVVDGELEIVSEPDRGTVVTITINERGLM